MSRIGKLPIPVPKGVTIAIDETPVGVFVEVEGSEQGVTDAARALGRGPGDYLLDSYRCLFMEYRRARGLPDTDMLFDGV